MVKAEREGVARRQAEDLASVVKRELALS